MVVRNITIDKMSSVSDVDTLTSGSLTASVMHAGDLTKMCHVNVLCCSIQRTFIFVYNIPRLLNLLEYKSVTVCIFPCYYKLHNYFITVFTTFIQIYKIKFAMYICQFLQPPLGQPFIPLHIGTIKVEAGYMCNRVSLNISEMIHPPIHYCAQEGLLYKNQSEIIFFVLVLGSVTELHKQPPQLWKQPYKSTAVHTS